LEQTNPGFNVKLMFDMSETFSKFRSRGTLCPDKEYRLWNFRNGCLTMTESEFPKHTANQKQILLCQGERKGNCRIHLKVIAQIVVIRRGRWQLKMDEMKI
jgi:hypothetical protein